MTAFRFYPGAARYDFDEGEMCIDPSKVDLDKVDRGVAQSLRIPLLQEFCKSNQIRFAMIAILIITDLSVFKSMIRPPESSAVRLTDPKWEEHILQIIAFGIAAWCDQEKLLFFSRYFGVLKTDTSARSIYNGKYFSSLCAAPPPVNLPSIPVLLAEISVLCKGELHMTVADWRHWFHEVALAEEISYYFGLAVAGDVASGKRFLRWKSLPMGWSWSPYIAQSLGFAIILATMVECGWSIEDYASLKTLPPFIRVRINGEYVALIALWYDNVALWSPHTMIAQSFFCHFGKVCRNFGAQTKHLDLHPAGRNGRDRTRNDNEELPSYIGIEFAHSKRRRPGGSGELEGVIWRHPSKKVAAWKALAAQIHPVMKNRLVAKIIGVAVWDCYMSLGKLLFLKPILLLASALGSHARVTSWESSINLTETQTLALQAAMKKICDNEWSISPTTKKRTRIFIAADSSKPRYGFICWSDSRVALVDGTRSGLWEPLGMLPAHIFVKELLAVVLAVEHVLSRPEMADESIEFVIVEDNTSAAQVIERGWSTTKIGLELLERLFSKLDLHHQSTIRIVTVRSEDNPADEPSRNKTVDPRRVSRMWTLIDLFENGNLHHSQNVSRRGYKRESNSTLRHGEESVDEENGCSDDDPFEADDDLIFAMYNPTHEEKPMSKPVSD